MQRVPMKRAMLPSTWCPTSKSCHRPKVRPWLSSGSTVRRAAQEEGNVRLEVLQQNGRPDHFVLLETWKDQKALDAHGTATHTAQLRDKLQPLRVSPFDERLHKGLAIGSALAARADGATYVVTHADAVPPGKDEALVLLKQLAETSRNDDGNVRFEVLRTEQSAEPLHDRRSMEGPAGSRSACDGWAHATIPREVSTI